MTAGSAERYAGKWEKELTTWNEGKKVRRDIQS